MSRTREEIQPPKWEPTAAEIATACEEIQREWSEHDWQRRGRSQCAGLTIDARMALSRAEMLAMQAEDW